MADLCTRAVTGSDYPAHQPIFICDTCQLYDDGGGGGDGLPCCICQSCAEICHAGHDVYYVGMGACSCDCPNMVIEPSMSGLLDAHHCQLAEQSKEEALRLGFSQTRPLNVPIPLKVPTPVVLPEVDVDEGVVEGKIEEDENDAENTDDDDKLTQSMSNVCIECRSSMGGYIYASYTLPGLAENGIGLCQNLIRQAEALAEESRDTFWLPDATGEIVEDGFKEWCDLEILAKEIYQRHVQTYSLQDLNENADEATPISPGGAEWWVQVKPAGTSRAPVDLHYDKDEVLAENFALGSFPTLSTVTYLTGEDDNQPTLVFPHTYNDEEDRPIESMLLSHAARAKHLVFDGRLLHGAPAHPALLRKKNNGVQIDDGTDRGSSLRVTFLVNIWKSGRPAGVNILPEPIRAKIRTVATEETSLERAMPLEFQKRHVSKLTVPEKLGSNAIVMTNAPDEEWIVLPFVSSGATWIGGDEEVADAAASSVAESLSKNDGDGDGSKSVPDEDYDDEEEEEEEDELVLVLSPFATPEYVDGKADTVIVDWEGKGAWLVRGALDDINVPGCPWKKLVEQSKNSTATKFLSDLVENVPSFVTSIVDKLQVQCDVDVTNLQADHVCYRTDSIEQYTSLVEALQSAGTDDFTLLVESEIGGRPIATFKLATPIEVESAGSNYSINVIEIPSPKEGSPYMAGLEHVEFVIGDGTHGSPLNCEAHQAALGAWMKRYSSVSWNTKALNKECNPDVSTKMELGDYGRVSIKFHLIPLEDVIEFEVGGV